MEQLHWWKLRKGQSSLSLQYQNGGFTNNLHGADFRVAVGSNVELAFDLSGNLRSRNKEENSVLDARAFADGDARELSVVQILDEKIIKGIADHLRSASPRPTDWRLTIACGKDWRFRVQSRAGGHDSLFLDVLEALD